MLAAICSCLLQEESSVNTDLHFINIDIFVAHQLIGLANCLVSNANVTATM